MFKKQHITIVIVVWNNLEKYTKACLDSIFKSTNEFYGMTYDVLFVDNASTDGTAEWLDMIYRTRGIRYVRNSENLGYCRAANVGLKEAIQRSDWVLMLNNDTIMHKGFLYQMLQAGESSEDCAAVGAKILRLGNPDYIIHSGTIVEKGEIKDPYCSFHKLSIQKSIYEPRLWVNGCAIMFRSSVIKKEGLFNEEFNWYFEEADYCCMLHQKGYKVLWCPQAEVEHAERATASLFPESSEKFFKAWDKFVEKWKPFYSKIRTKTTPSVGIVLPSYNSSKYVEKTLSSIFAQTYRNWRLYFVDDCSTDDSFNKSTKMITDYKSVLKKHPCANRMQDFFFDNFRILKTDKNGGVSAARNVALNQIRMDNDIDYIAYIDSDDIWNNNHLETMMKFLIYNPEYDFAYSDPIHTFEDGHPGCGMTPIPFGIPYHTDIDTEKLKTENPIFTSSIVHKMQLIHKVGEFDSRLDSIEDWDYWNRIAENGYKMFHIPLKNFKYIVRESGNVAALRNEEKTRIFKEKRSGINT